MPLNGPIQADGRELKASHTQKPLGGREGSSSGVCPKEGRPTHHKRQCEDFSAYSVASSRCQLHSTPYPKRENGIRGWRYM